MRHNIGMCVMCSKIDPTTSSNISCQLLADYEVMQWDYGGRVLNSIPTVKPGLHFERKSTAHTQTILRTWGAFFSATNADLRRRDRSGAECKHSYNMPYFYAWMLDCHWLIASNLCAYASFYATYKINPSPWNGTQPIFLRCLRIRAEIYAWSVNAPTRVRCVDSFAHFGCVRTAYGV